MAICHPNFLLVSLLVLSSSVFLLMCVFSGFRLNLPAMTLKSILGSGGFLSRRVLIVFVRTCGIELDLLPHPLFGLSFVGLLWALFVISLCLDVPVGPSLL